MRYINLRFYLLTYIRRDFVVVTGYYPISISPLLPALIQFSFRTFSLLGSRKLF